MLTLGFVKVTCGTEPLGDSINIFNDIEKQQFGKNIKLAFLTVDNNDCHRTFGIILETITNIEGNHFINYDQAVKWLCEN